MKKTLNTKEDIPESFFIFYSPSFINEHNFKLSGNKIISTAFSNLYIDKKFLEKYVAGDVNYLRFVPNQECDIMSPSSFDLSINNTYTLEYNLETYRRNHTNTKLYPSRLSAVYAFSDFDTCKRVAVKHRWDITSVKEFKLLDNGLNRVVKVNMDMVSNLRGVTGTTSFSPKGIENIASSYWSGTGKLELDVPNPNNLAERLHIKTEIIWEYLIEGILEEV